MRCLCYALLLVGTVANQCPSGDWYEFSGSCYSKQAHGNHSECATICARSNASLVHIKSKAENDFVTYIADDEFCWIGYYRVMNPLDNSEGFWGLWTSSEDGVDKQAYK